MLAVHGAVSHHLRQFQDKNIRHLCANVVSAATGRAVRSPVGQFKRDGHTCNFWQRKIGGSSRGLSCGSSNTASCGCSSTRCGMSLSQKRMSLVVIGEKVTFIRSYLITASISKRSSSSCVITSRRCPASDLNSLLMESPSVSTSKAVSPSMCLTARGNLIVRLTSAAVSTRSTDKPMAHCFAEQIPAQCVAALTVVVEGAVRHTSAGFDGQYAVL